MKTMAQIMAEDRRQMQHFKKNISRAHFAKRYSEGEKEAAAYVRDNARIAKKKLG